MNLSLSCHKDDIQDHLSAVVPAGTQRELQRSATVSSQASKHHRGIKAKLEGSSILNLPFGGSLKFLLYCR